jgi:hypothetical protein
MPRDAAERAELIRVRPDGWEDVLFAGILKESKDALEPKWQEHWAGNDGSPRRQLGSGDAMPFLREAFSELRGIARRVTDPIFDGDNQRLAFGTARVPGDPARIEELARGIATSYQAMLDRAGTVRRTRPPIAFARAFELAAGAADRPLIEIREFIEGVAGEVIQPCWLSVPPGTVRRSLTLTVDKALLRELRAEVARLRQAPRVL